MGSKIIRFLREMDDPSRNLDKANFPPEKKGKQCAAFGYSNEVNFHLNSLLFMAII